MILRPTKAVRKEQSLNKICKSGGPPNSLNTMTMISLQVRTTIPYAKKSPEMLTKTIIPPVSQTDRH